jgi:hypothetical protein
MTEQSITSMIGRSQIKTFVFHRDLVTAQPRRTSRITSRAGAACRDAILQEPFVICSSHGVDPNCPLIQRFLYYIQLKQQSSEIVPERENNSKATTLR